MIHSKMTSTAFLTPTIFSSSTSASTFNGRTNRRQHLSSRTTTVRPRACRLRMSEEIPSQPENDATTPTPTPTPGKKMNVQNTAPSTKKLVRNKPGMESTQQSKQPQVYADARAGDMVGAPEVGEGLGPKRGDGEKKVTKAAAIQKSQSFADAWAEQNQGKVDVWIIIGAVTLLTPIGILVWAVATGVIPTGGLFE